MAKKFILLFMSAFLFCACDSKTPKKVSGTFSGKKQTETKKEGEKTMDIEIKSEVGRGTLVVVKLPLQGKGMI